MDGRLVQRVRVQRGPCSTCGVMQSPSAPPCFREGTAKRARVTATPIPHPAAPKGKERHDNLLRGAPAGDPSVAPLFQPHVLVLMIGVSPNIRLRDGAFLFCSTLARDISLLGTAKVFL